MNIPKELKKEIILDHYKNPRNKKLTKDESYLSHHENSASCIDDIEVQAKIDNGIVKDVCFDGVACSISTASTSIMCEMMPGKSIAEAEHFIEQYHNMLFEKPYDAELLGELIAFDELHMQANRIKCGYIGMLALTKILEQYKNENP